MNRVIAIAAINLIAVSLIGCSRDGSPRLDVSVRAKGEWSRADCLHTLVYQAEYRKLCVDGSGARAFTLSVDNTETRAVTIPSCTVEAFDAAGTSLGTAVVPVKFTYGEPFPHGLVQGNGRLTFDWFIEGVSDSDARLVGSCPGAAFFTGPTPG